jgi:tetratricopeptide (TPR) repeat protein
VKEDLALTSIEAAKIIEVAEWPQYEKTGLWYARVAKVLREAGHLDEAIHYFEEAMKLDESFWLSEAGLAIAYAEREEYQKAIDTIAKARGRFDAAAEQDPEMKTKYKGFAYSNYKLPGEWNYALGKKDAAVENYMRAIKLYPRDVELILRVLVIWHEEKKWMEIMGLLEEMKNDIIPETGYSRLVEITQKYTYDDEPFYNIVVHAAREAGNLDFARENILMSLKAARKESKVGVAGLLQYWFGLFTLRHHRDVEKAIQIWEQIMETSFATQTVSALGYARILAAIQLSLRYFDQAITAGKGTVEADISIHKLENLSKQRATDAPNLTAEKVPFVFSTRDTTLVLGLLYRLFGNKKEARECFKAHISLAIDLLTDEDPSNDWQGFMKLADIFNFADDMVNLDASYSLLGPRAEDLDDGEGEEEEDEGVEEEIEEGAEPSSTEGPSKPESEDAETSEGNKKENAETAEADKKEEDERPKGEDKKNEDDLEGDMGYTCDGPCEVKIHNSHPSIRLIQMTNTYVSQREWSKPDPLHMCRYCLNIAFCEDCIKLLKNDKLPYMICNPKHEFYDVPKVTKRLSKGMVLYKGKEVPIGGWLNGLRKEWGL